MIETLVVLLAAAIIAVPLSRRFGLGSILGYLVAGIAIGPSGLRLVTDVEQIAGVSELGVIMLLFLIGLELRPQRLNALRKDIIGLGLGQMVPTTLLLTGLAHLAGIAWPGAIALGAGLALSSTAIVLPMLGERELLPSAAGRDAFVVLLFQDMAFIPLVALVPLLAGDQVTTQIPWVWVGKSLLAIAVILIGGSYLIRPLFRLIGGAKVPEIFTATALFLVVGTAALAHWAGLSVSLGAFMAGVLLSNSEYRHELQADIKPFEGLLLGFFFISVGMSANLGLAIAHPLIVISGLLALIIAKVVIAFALSWFKHRDPGQALRFALALPEGSEFSFVLFATAVSAGALAQAQADLATVVVALSMVTTPALFAASEKFIVPRLIGKTADPTADKIYNSEPPVIICGFGRVGQIVGRVLLLQKIPFTALDKDIGQVDVVRRFGMKVYFGNPAREEVLRAAGAETAKIIVVALDDMEETVAAAETIKRHFSNVRVYARARNRRHAHRLMDVGVAGIVRETFYSSLKLTELVLKDLDVPEERAKRALELFEEHDERSLIATQQISGDEKRLIQSLQDARAELTQVFETDQAGQDAVARS
ncbi:CPA2 family monovalent cation:H+ antiporter-2/glutathione-regulated potassium-efflux system protein KefB [Rhizomicrobium palustre]|uniref:CPA2 family monovalent cation:H+ antiporter-2/glutathione-regulated potassium-efflux system protein KefB n=1 Tax=Rhizomicrobium palustre TaxID=189966 RepID=A0A846MUK5_9PROT|nr:monovalent cation:proton antiporter-2 (CPA2) family protein [Rhizomicrobium palustre]NIK86760.1 CPA2 family monovalent cation:H+ antiporter-2/glutathione-regulated potassium-efflux system protein KefB [Rhizomicrobium palustre]